MQVKIRSVILIFCVVCLLMTSGAALKVTGFVCEKKISSGDQFSCPVMLESDTTADLTFDVNGSGFELEASELRIYPDTPLQITITGTAPAQGFIKVTAIDASTSGSVKYGVASFIKICVNKPCPVILPPTPEPTTPQPTITTLPTIEPIETITTIPEVTPFETLEPKDNRGTYTLIGAVCLGLFVAIALILYIREKRSKK